MGAGIDISVETEKMFTTLDAYPRLLGIDVGKAARRQTRILAQRLMATTPPHNGKFGTNSGTGNSEESRMLGVMAIVKDLRRLIYPMETEAYSGFHRHFGSMADRVTLSTGTFSNVAITEDVGVLRREHQRQRNRRGRVAKNTWLKVITTEATFETYFEEVARKVGIAKSGWLPALAHFGGMSPAWIARHGMGNGSVVDMTNENGAFSIELINFAPSIGSMAPRLVKTAVGAQTGAMIRELEKAAGNAAFRARLTKEINAA